MPPSYSKKLRSEYIQNDIDWYIARLCENRPSEYAFTRREMSFSQIVKLWAIKKHDQDVHVERPKTRDQIQKKFGR